MPSTFSTFGTVNTSSSRQDADVGNNTSRGHVLSSADAVFGEVWQKPHLNVFKKAKVFDGKNSTVKGDVKVVMDKSIGKRVFRIRGLIGAANCLTVPAEGPKTPILGLGCTGTNVYLQVQALRTPSTNEVNTFASIHVDANTKEHIAVRLSFSNLHKEVKFSGRIVQIPLVLEDTRWTVLALNLPEILAQYTGYSFHSVKSFKICSNLLCRTIFTTDLELTPATLPRDVSFPLQRGQQWQTRYNWMTYSAPGGWTQPEFSTHGGDENAEPAVSTSEANLAGLDTDMAQMPSASTTKRIVEPVPFSEFSAEKATPSYEDVMSVSPLMSLQKVIGYSMSAEADNLQWCPNNRHFVFSTNNTIVIMDSKTGRQRFLFGHTAPINVITFSQTGLMATGQSGATPLIRVWDFSCYVDGGLADNAMTSAHNDTADHKQEGVSDSGLDDTPLAVPCLAVLRAHNHGLCSITISKRGELLAAVGRDHADRVFIVVWNIGEIFNNGEAVVVGKQLSEFSVSRLVFSPYDSDPFTMVSCGERSIRFWRINNGHLPASSVSLGEHVRNNFTDLDFEARYGDGDVTQKRFFVSSATGSVFQVNYERRELEFVYQLHSGPIHSISVNEGFCVTGAGDRFLRVWPLDFSDYYLQAQHKAEVFNVSISLDGLRVIVGTGNGSIGVLDLATTAYQTILRSHTGTINQLAVDPHPERSEFATVSGDGTVRVWSMLTLHQLYEFFIPNDEALCLAYHPHAGQDYKLAVGFASGSVRVLDVTTATLFVDYQQHEQQVDDIKFSPDASLLFSSSRDGNICVYDVAANYQPLRMFTCYRSGLLDGSVGPATKSPFDEATKRSASVVARAASGNALSRSVLNDSSLDDSASMPTSSSLLVGGRTSFVATQGVPGVRHCMTISRDGALLATIGSDAATIIIVDTREMREIKRFSTCGAPVNNLAFTAAADQKDSDEVLEDLLVVLTNMVTQRYSISSGRLTTELQIPPSAETNEARRPESNKRVHRREGDVQPITCASLALAPLGFDGLVAVADSAGVIQLCIPDNKHAIKRAVNANLHPLRQRSLNSGLKQVKCQRFGGHFGRDAEVTGMQFLRNHLISVCGDAVFVWDINSPGSDVQAPVTSGKIETPTKMIPLSAEELAQSGVNTDAVAAAMGAALQAASDVAWEEESDVKSPEPAVSEHQHPLIASASRAALLAIAKQKVSRQCQLSASGQLVVQEEGEVDIFGAEMSVTGYNGEGRANLLWDATSGAMLYSVGSTVVCDNLNANLGRVQTVSSQIFLKHADAPAEISTLCLVHLPVVDEDEYRSAKQSMVASGCANGDVALWSLEGRQLVSVLRGSTNGRCVQSVAFSSCFKYMMVASTTTYDESGYPSCVVALWDWQREQLLETRLVNWSVHSLQATPEPSDNFDWGWFERAEFVSVGNKISCWSVEHVEFALQDRVPFVEGPQYTTQLVCRHFPIDLDDDLAVEEKQAAMFRRGEEFCGLDLISRSTNSNDLLGIVVGTTMGQMVVYDVHAKVVGSWDISEVTAPREAKSKKGGSSPIKSKKKDAIRTSSVGELNFCQLHWEDAGTAGTQAFIVVGSSKGQVFKFQWTTVGQLVAGADESRAQAMASLRNQEDQLVEAPCQALLGNSIVSMCLKTASEGLGQFGVVGTSDGTIWALQLPSSRPKLKSPFPMRLVNSCVSYGHTTSAIVTHRTHPFAVSSGSDGSLRCWRISPLKSDLLLQFVVPGAECTACAFSTSFDDESTFVGAFSDGKLRFFGIKSLELKQTLNLKEITKCKGVVSSLVYAHRGETLVVGTSKGELFLLEWRQKRVTRFPVLGAEHKRGHANHVIKSIEVASHAHSQRGCNVLISDTGGCVSVWYVKLDSDVEASFKCRRFRTLPGGESVTHFHPSLTNVLVTIPHDDHTVFMYDFESNAFVGRVSLDHDPVDAHLVVRHKHLLVYAVEATGSYSVYDLGTEGLPEESELVFHGSLVAPASRIQVTGKYYGHGQAGHLVLCSGNQYMQTFAEQTTLALDA